VKIIGGLPGLQSGYGPSHQATDDLAILGAMPNLTIIDPCDAVEMMQATKAVAEFEGPVYMRLLRGNRVPIVLDQYDYHFEIGKAKLLRDGAVPMMGTELEELQKGNDSDVKPNVMLDFLVPIMILVGTAIWTYIAKGGVKILECFIITVIYMAIELSIRKVFKSVTDLVNTAVQGMKSVMSATLILALAYCINTITKSMGAADFLLGVCESWMTPALFLSVAFIAGAVISFFTGSSWGTFAICIPIAVPMAYSFTGGQLGTLVYAAVGAVVSGGLFGDHCSPVSDTTVLSSLGAACDHIDHVRTQLPYALLAAAVSMILWVVVAMVGGAA